LALRRKLAIDRLFCFGLQCVGDDPISPVAAQGGSQDREFGFNDNDAEFERPSGKAKTQWGT